MFRFLCVLLRDFHLRRRICPPVGNVSEQCAWYSNVDSRSGTLDRHIPHRSADAMASCQCSAFCSSRHLLPLCADVCPISAHHVETCPWDHRQDARGNRTLLERTLSLICLASSFACIYSPTVSIPGNYWLKIYNLSGKPRFLPDKGKESHPMWYQAILGKNLRQQQQGILGKCGRYNAPRRNQR